MFALSFAPNITGSIRVFNDSSDKDKLKNYPKNPYEVLNSGEAMIRYDLSAGLKAALGFEFKNIGFDFNADQKVIVSSYNIHSNEETLNHALIRDISNFKFIFSPDNVKSLKPNEGLALQYLGSVEANLELSFADAYTGTISVLSNFLPEGTGIKAEVNVGASVGFSLKIEDDFKAFIKKNSNGNYSVVINKSAVSTKAGSVNAGVTAQLLDDENLKSLQNLLFDSLLSESVEKVDDIVENKLDNLSDTEETIIKSIINRLGWEIDLSEPDQIKGLYDKLKKGVIEKATKFLTTKLELGFKFEYQRIDSKNTLFEATLTQAAVENGLRDIVTFKVSALSDMDGVEVTKFLLKKTKVISNKFGVALQFGDFKAHWYKMNSYTEEFEDNRLENKKKYSVALKQEVESKFTNHKKWFIGLNAEMDQPQETPHTNDFDFEFMLHWEDKERKTKRDELVQFIDMAVIWNCIPESDFGAVIDRLSKLILNKQDVKFSCHLHIPKGTMEMLFDSLPIPELTNPELVKPESSILLDSLSEAVPYADFNFREKPSVRKIVYNSIWKTYLVSKALKVQPFA
ncbi:MAG: hypothetical protein GY714_25960, partial [Desulfobacterales bacterium]|nr:hypothetical protein [Desulfobacterales bacterium]